MAISQHTLTILLLNIISNQPIGLCEPQVKYIVDTESSTDSGTQEGSNVYFLSLFLDGPVGILCIYPFFLKGQNHYVKHPSTLRKPLHKANPYALGKETDHKLLSVLLSKAS